MSEPEVGRSQSVFIIENRRFNYSLSTKKGRFWRSEMTNLSIEFH